MAWWWRYEMDPTRVTGVVAVDDASVRSVTFPTRSDAETWVGEQWRDLLASGITSVVLVRDGVAVYGPMHLHPAS